MSRWAVLHQNVGAPPRWAVLHQNVGAPPRWAALVVCVALGACANARATKVDGPDGEPGWLEIDCRDSHHHCNAKARELCGGAFEVAENEGRYDVGPSAPYYSGRMVIRCTNGSAEASAPDPSAD